MANINSLLNPMSEKRDITPVAPRSGAIVMQSPNSSRKKAKLTKDAPVFQHGPIRGECRFPPDEYQNEELAAYHQQFDVSPFGEIADYPRHIPYNSEKKAFLERTNREYLEVFQYTFKKPGDETQYTMLWDYNIGLVRTTPLFKCTGHSKTTPAKMLNKNPGLRDICHSITGGALVAQGYWIPHAAAKAIAATFCYEIRFALTPVFGHDFPQLCIKPGSEGYGDMTIDPAITKYCTEEAKRFRAEELASTPHRKTPPLDAQQVSPLPRHNRTIRMKPAKLTQSPHDSPYLSPYDSDPESDNNFSPTPSTPPIFRNPWVSVNRPKTIPRSVPHPDRRLPSPRTIMAGHANRSDITLDVACTPPPTVTSRDPSTEVSPTTLTFKSANTFRDASKDEPKYATEQGRDDKIQSAIDVLSSETGMTLGEVRRRLGLFETGSKLNHHLDAAITMESLKTGLAWEAVASRLDVQSDGHKRSSSW